MNLPVVVADADLTKWTPAFAVYCRNLLRSAEQQDPVRTRPVQSPVNSRSTLRWGQKSTHAAGFGA